MKISIVTPTYNSAKYVRETMDSIHAQNYHDLEHIVMDAVSRDNTLDIVKEYNGVTVISEKDKGQSDALNKGFKHVTGDILAWQNSDDLYCKDTFTTVEKYFREHPEVDMVYGNYQLIDSESNWICDVFPPHWNKWLFVHGRFCPVQPSVFWRKTVWDEAGPLSEHLHFCMDVDFYSRSVNKKFKIAKIDHILGIFRVHDTSKTQNKENQRKVYNEYKKVLADNFNYSLADSALFEFFTARAKVAGIVKQKILKKW